MNRMPANPLIVYIPGLKPKPEAELHKAQLLRCLREGLRRIDEKSAGEMAAPGMFHLVSWTYDFYGEYRDINLDMAFFRKRRPARQIFWWPLRGSDAWPAQYSTWRTICRF